jgi:hypothetical protein
VDEFVLIVMVIIATVGIAAVLIYSKKEKQRREELRTLAGRLGFTFVRDGDPVLMERLPAFQLFSRGRHRRHRNVMQGERRRVAVTISEYRYTTGGGRSSNTHVQTVLVLQSDRLDLPRFGLRPQHFGHRLATRFGYQDIDLAGQPMFSEHYLLQGEDEAAIRATFDDRVVACFTRQPTLTIEGERDTLLIYRPRRRPRPEELETFLEQGMEIVSCFARRPKEEPVDESFLDEALAALQDLGTED